MENIKMHIIFNLSKSDPITTVLYLPLQEILNILEKFLI